MASPSLAWEARLRFHRHRFAEAVEGFVLDLADALAVGEALAISLR